MHTMTQPTTFKHIVEFGYGYFAGAYSKASDEDIQTMRTNMTDMVLSAITMLHSIKAISSEAHSILTWIAQMSDTGNRNNGDASDWVNRDELFELEPASTDMVALNELMNAGMVESLVSVEDEVYYRLNAEYILDAFTRFFGGCENTLFRVMPTM